MIESNDIIIKNLAPQTQENSVKSDVSFGERIKESKWLQILEIVIVFSPVVLLILGYRILNFDNPMILITAVWIGQIIMLGLIWLGIILRGESWQSIGLSFGRPKLPEVGWTVLKSIPIFVFAIVGFVFGAILMANIVGIPEGADMTKYNYLSGNLPMLFISLIAVWFASSFGEEVVYRGFLITRLQEMFGSNAKKAVIATLFLSSVIFGLAHFEWGITGIVQTTFMGLALGISYFVTKRKLWSLIIAHGYMDTILLVQLYFAT